MPVRGRGDLRGGQVVRTLSILILLGAALWWLLPLVTCNCPECSGARV